MSEYTPEFHEFARTHPTDVSAVGLNCLLDEIEDLQALIGKLSEDGEFFYQHYMHDNPLPAHQDEIEKHRKLMKEINEILVHSLREFPGLANAARR